MEALQILIEDLDNAIRQFLEQEDKRELLRNTETNFVLFHFCKAVYGRLWVRIRRSELSLANPSVLSLMTVLDQKLQEYVRLHGWA